MAKRIDKVKIVSKRGRPTRAYEVVKTYIEVTPKHRAEISKWSIEPAEECVCLIPDDFVAELEKAMNAEIQMSQRFMLRQYLQMTPEQIEENDRLLREELTIGRV